MTIEDARMTNDIVGSMILLFILGFAPFCMQIYLVLDSWLGSGLARALSILKSKVENDSLLVISMIKGILMYSVYI